MNIPTDSFQKLCAVYLTELRVQRQNPHATSELSLRAALDNLLQGARQLSERDVVFTGEGKKIAQGRPDFVVTAGGIPVGYIEVEKMEADLDKLTGHSKAQNEGFIQNLDHFLLTNHLDFRLFHGGKLVAEASLPEAPEKGAPMVPEAKAEKLYALLEQLMGAEQPPITSPRDLAFHLSRRARQMNAAVLETLQDPDAEIHNDYNAFKEVLLPNLKPAEFADLYAQTFAYGLFAARCNFHAPDGKFTRGVAGEFLTTNPFLKKLFTRFAGELDKNLVWIADDMTALLAGAPMDSIRDYFYQRTGNADPMIDFYEPFLRAYDAGLRDLRGVYYTPQPVVKYIVRSVHHLLKQHFGKARGLADEKTLVLDPATGTGSFLFAVIDQIHDEVTTQKGSAAWGGYVEQHLLHRIFGFELMMAPYSIAHLKLGLQLAGQGAPVVEGERFGIYLTNTLDDAIKQGDTLFAQFVSDEANAAVKIKNGEPILVVLGNPPYSGVSANASHDARGKLNAIGELIDAYKFVDGEALNERKHWLQDDYVKFIAFAQERIRKTGEGVVGYITNHGYLDNPTFRGMRQSLLQTFTDIYVLDLHGNAKKKEKSPDGSADQNVFEIQQGVAIMLCVKEKGKTGTARVHHADLWGKQKEKYDVLDNGDVSTTEWQELQPSSPMYFFVPQDTELLPEYSEGWKVTDIFPTNSAGFITARDRFVIDFDEPSLMKRISEFANSQIPDDTIRSRYFSGRGSEKYAEGDTRGWKLPEARRRVQADSQWHQRAQQCLYRPFDFRSVYWTEAMVDWSRPKVMRNLSLTPRDNLALLTSRMTKGETFAHTLVTRQITEVICLSPSTSNNAFVFLLYLYPEQSTLGFDDERRPNLSPAFLKALGEKLNLPPAGEHHLPQGISPEDIFHYAYAIFHAPAYRERYAPFLKTDFPRLPLTSDLQLFRDLAELGQQLVARHLLDVAAAPVLDAARHRFEGAGSGIVEKPEYSEATQRVKINADQGFENVPRAVWEFRVGGYQVADKWLKDRKGRVLSYDDITHYARVLIALAETIRLMQEIDNRIDAWPLV